MSQAYHLWIEDQAKKEIRNLPGNMRQRIRRMIQSLQNDPRPISSIELKNSGTAEYESRRIKMNNWRLVYVVHDEFQEIGIITVRKRPPYDYSDLSDLLADFTN